MSRSNVTMMLLLYAVCWIFSESTAVDRPDWLADYDHGDSESDSASVRDMGERLGAILRTESSWWPNTKSDNRENGQAKTVEEAVATEAVTTTTAVPTSSNRFGSAQEFFRTLRGEKKMSTANRQPADDDSADDSVENGPTATGVVDSELVSATEPTVTAKPTTVKAKTTTKVTQKQTAFGTENQCVVANNGRPCICNMTDFLKLVGRWLDDVPATAAADDDTAAVAALKCHSYKVLPESFNVSSSAAVGDIVDHHPQQQMTVNGATDVSDGIEVDLNQVINYRLEKSENDHYVVHYNLVGTDVKIRCLVNENGDNKKIISFKWRYKKTKHKTNSTITGTDAPNLLILGFAPEDSKNYTCTPAIEEFENITSYKHYVIVDLHMTS